MIPNERSKVEGDFHQLLRGFDGLEARWLKCFQTSSVNGASYQHDVNCFLRVQLGNLECSTFEARMCLEDNINYKRWLNLLARYVIPLLAQHQLPLSFKEFQLCQDQQLFG